MKKIVTTTIITVSLLLLVIVCGGCGGGDGLSAKERAELKKIHKRVGSSNVSATTEGRQDTSLHIAAWGGHLGIVKYLVSKGADVNAKNVAGEVPLHHAVNCRHLEVVKYLVSHGANPNAQHIAGGTPLHDATSGYDARALEIIEFLISRMADVNIRNDNGKTPEQLLAEKLGVEQARKVFGTGTAISTVICATCNGSGRWGRCSHCSEFVGGAAGSVSSGCTVCQGTGTNLCTLCNGRGTRPAVSN